MLKMRGFHNHIIVGKVNHGESFVYCDELSCWYDFSDMIDTIRKNSDDEYTQDYDNFSIKSYCSFANKEDMEKLDDTKLPELDFAEPAGMIDVHGLGILLLLYRQTV